MNRRTLSQFLLTGLVLLSSSAAEAELNVDILGFSSEPSVPGAGEPFEIHIEVLSHGCGAEVDSVNVSGSTIEMVGVTGPPIDGGCGGVVYESTIVVPVAELSAGLYQVELSFFTRREGDLTASATWQVAVDGLAVPGLSSAGLLLLALLLGYLGSARLAV